MNELGGHEGRVTRATPLHLPASENATSVTFTAPRGVFFVRVHAVAGVLRSLPSNEVSLVVGVPAAPAAPTALLGADAVSVAATNPCGIGPATVPVAVTVP